MRRNPHVLICLVLLIVPALRADVTLRYETKTTLNPNLPPQITEALMKSLSISLPGMSTQQFHNGKLYYSQAKLNLIFDSAKSEITIIDVQGKRYATVAADQYSAALRDSVQVPEQAKAMLAAIKVHAESAPGATATAIQGIQADDHALVMTLDSSGAQGLPAGPMARMNLHLWMAKGSEAMRVGALREVAGYNLMSTEALNPAATIQQMLQQLPGMGDSFAALQKDLASSGSTVMLRTQVEMFVPMMAALMKPGADANAPMVQLTQELTQISTDPIPDSVFEVPAGYQKIAVAEILKSVIPAVPGK